MRVIDSNKNKSGIASLTVTVSEFPEHASTPLMIIELAGTIVVEFDSTKVMLLMPGQKVDWEMFNSWNSYKPIGTIEWERKISEVS